MVLNSTVARVVYETLYRELKDTSTDTSTGGFETMTSVSLPLVCNILNFYHHGVSERSRSGLGSFTRLIFSIFQSIKEIAL